MRLALLLLLAASAAYPQRLLSFGAKLGYPAKDVWKEGLVTSYTVSPLSGRFTLGPTVELNLPHRVSIEADLLYRSADFDLRTTGSQRVKGTEWRIPILLKYRVRGGLVRPFLAAGPTWQLFTGFDGPLGLDTETNKGVTAAAGLEGKLALVRLSGELRYTRWGAATIGNLASGLTNVNKNQVEMLLGVTF